MGEEELNDRRRRLKQCRQPEDGERRRIDKKELVTFHSRSDGCNICYLNVKQEGSGSL